MKPFGQWLNEQGPAKTEDTWGEATKDQFTNTATGKLTYTGVGSSEIADLREAEDTVEIVLENSPSVHWLVPCKCANCNKYLNPRHFGLEPDEVKGDEYILCDDCWEA